MSERQVALPQCTLTYQADGVVLCDQHPEVNQTRESTLALFDAVQSLTDEPALFLVLMNGQHTDKEARVMLARTDRFRAVGMVVSSRVGTMLINFFLRVNRPMYPMSVFTTEAEARAWLVAQPEGNR